jgi:tetratricopeptide (TPR) repeat protein
MGKLVRLTTDEHAPGAADAAARRIPRLRTRYYAFLSYSHKDKELADWLHRELERFRVPRSIAGTLTANGVVPRRLSPIFRDEQDLSAGGDLAEEIKAALAASQFLVVLCSPMAAKSRWTNQEIESFKRTRPEGCVLAAVVAGEPFVSDMPGREDEECFPPALRYKYNRRGHQTTKRAEPLAADFRQDGEGKRLAFLKLVAGMLGVGLDELVRREQTRRQRRLAWVAAASLAGMTLTSGLAVVALQARDAARDQRREAEGLVAFMLGDLKDKLEPIGKLDALDGVGSRVLAYYSNQDASELTDAALTQRSKALSLMAQVADARGDSQTAQNLYRQAMAGTAEAMRRDPTNAEAIFDHAQNVFYVGQIAQNAGDFGTAEASMREYQRLARRMVAFQADSMKYRMEEQYADANLGIVLFDQRRFEGASTQFRAALAMIEAISTADPSKLDYRKGIAESLAWLADAERAAGRYSQAIAFRQRDIALLETLLRQTGSVEFRQRLIPARRALGNLYADRGQGEAAMEQLRGAMAQADMLTTVEPNNILWQEYSFKTRLALTKYLLLSGNLSEAAEQTVRACDSVSSVLRHGPAKPEWRKSLVSCLMLRAGSLRAQGSKPEALGFARQALSVAQSIHTSDSVGDAFIVAKCGRLVGDLEREVGRADAARSAWAAALTVIPTTVPEQPDEIAEHAALLQRLGRAGDAQPRAARLKAMGYRLPV